MYNILWFKKLFLSEKNILSIAYLINSKNNVTNILELNVYVSLKMFFLNHKHPI